MTTLVRIIAVIGILSLVAIAVTAEEPEKDYLGFIEIGEGDDKVRRNFYSTEEPWRYGT